MERRIRIAGRTKGTPLSIRTSKLSPKTFLPYLPYPNPSPPIPNLVLHPPHPSSAQVLFLTGASPFPHRRRSHHFLAQVRFFPTDLRRKTAFHPLHWRRSPPFFHTCANNTPHLRQKQIPPAPLGWGIARARGAPAEFGFQRTSEREEMGVPEGMTAFVRALVRPAPAGLTERVRRQDHFRPRRAAESRMEPVRPEPHYPAQQMLQNAPEISTRPVDNFLWKNLEKDG